MEIESRNMVNWDMCIGRDSDLRFLWMRRVRDVEAWMVSEYSVIVVVLVIQLHHPGHSRATEKSLEDQRT
jgi:hypothetical protein